MTTLTSHFRILASECPTSRTFVQCCWSNPNAYCTFNTWSQVRSNILRSWTKTTYLITKLSPNIPIQGLLYQESLRRLWMHQRQWRESLRMILSSIEISTKSVNIKVTAKHTLSLQHIHYGIRLNIARNNDINFGLQRTLELPVTRI
jgi:hypothetical protein